MGTTIVIVFLNSIVWAMVNGNITPISSYWLLFVLGFLNFGCCLPRPHESEILRLIAGISGVICWLFAFAYAPFWVKIFVFIFLLGGRTLYTRHQWKT